MADGPIRQLWLSLQERAWNEGQAVKQAPTAFALAVLVAWASSALLIWRVVDTLYAERIAVLQATIQQLQAAKQDPARPAQPRDPDGIFQLGRQVGKVESPRIDESKSTVSFDQITGAVDFDMSREFEYRNYVLQVRSIASESTANMSGLRARRLLGVTCSLVGRK